MPFTHMNQFYPFNDCEYMKNHICKLRFLRNEYESDLRCDGHYLSSNESEAVIWTYDLFLSV